MDEPTDPHRDAKRRLVECVESTGAWSQAAVHLGLSTSAVRELRAADPAFNEALRLAADARRVQVRQLVEQRLLAVVLHGHQEIQTYQGRIVYQTERDDSGHPILEPATDCDGNPAMRIDKHGDAHPILRERLSLDPLGNPIPVTVPRYAERTTLEVAKAYGLLEPVSTDDEEEGAEAVVLIDSNGEVLSFSAMLRRIIEAQAPPGQLMEASDADQEGQGQG